MSNTAQQIAPSVGCDRNQAAALSAVLPGTMSNRLVASHVDDRGAPNLGSPPAFPPEQRFLSMPTAPTSPIRSVSAPRRASPQRTTSLFTVCQSQPSSAATSSTERPRPPTPTVTHLAARDVNNARWGPIVGSCSMNDLISHPGFGHVQRRFRHRSRTGRPNAGKSTNTTGNHTDPPHATHNGRALRDPITTPSGAPSPGSLIPTRPTSPRPTNNSHMRAGISFHRGPPASDVITNTRLWRTPHTSSGFQLPLADPLLPTPHLSTDHASSTSFRHRHSIMWR